MIQLPLPADLTHHEILICMWLGSDLPLLEQMRLLVEGDGFEAKRAAHELGATIYEMLYDPLYSYYPQHSYGVPDLLRVMQNGGDTNKARVARASLPKMTLLDMPDEGWMRIRNALLAGCST